MNFDFLSRAALYLDAWVRRFAVYISCVCCGCGCRTGQNSTHINGWVRQARLDPTLGLMFTCGDIDRDLRTCKIDEALRPPQFLPFMHAPLTVSSDGGSSTNANADSSDAKQPALAESQNVAALTLLAQSLQSSSKAGGGSKKAALSSLSSVEDASKSLVELIVSCNHAAVVCKDEAVPKYLGPRMLFPKLKVC